MAAVEAQGSGIRLDILFLLNGITSLLGWNAVLTSLDYFAYVYPMNVYQYFPIPLFIGYVISGACYNILSLKISYKYLVCGGIIITNVSLILLFILSLLFQGESANIGFWLSLILCFILGFGGNCTQLTFFAMINFLSGQVVSRFTIGTALSGLSVTFVRLVIVAIAGSDRSNKVPIIIYFAIAIVYNFIDMILNIRFFGTETYRDKIQIHRRAAEQSDSDNRNIKNMQSLLDSNSNQNDALAKEQKTSYIRYLIGTSKAIFPYPFLILINYVITFILFPDITLKKTFEDLDIVWSSLLFLVTYNIGDTVGKIIGDFRFTFNEKSTVYITFARCYFFISLTYLATDIFNQDVLFNNYVFPFLNQFLFAVTNGFVTNICFILSFEKSPNQFKKYAGVLGGLCLQFGIMLGTFANIPYELIVFGNNTDSGKIL